MIEISEPEHSNMIKPASQKEPDAGSQWLSDRWLIEQPVSMEFVRVPEGIFLMGSDRDCDSTADDDEVPQHSVMLSEYWIGRTQVTIAQYDRFIQDQGYQQEEYWSAAGWSWRMGKWESDLTIYNADWQKEMSEWLPNRPPSLRDLPFHWRESRWNEAEQPVVGVCWFEVEAYINWLNALGEVRFQLPSEAQWEKAARGTDGGIYPWGNVWDGARSNTNESKIGKTAAVGSFSPDGDSPYGCTDMVGNVWEWCQDWYDAESYRRRAGRVVADPTGPPAGKARVAHGGAWYLDRKDVRCARRLMLVPDYFGNGLGFRLVLSQIPTLKAPETRTPSQEDDNCRGVSAR
jgi:formylglycine-generating enzyme required for sulfatase activity